MRLPTVNGVWSVKVNPACIVSLSNPDRSIGAQTTLLPTVRTQPIPVSAAVRPVCRCSGWDGFEFARSDAKPVSVHWSLGAATNHRLRAHALSLLSLLSVRCGPSVHTVAEWYCAVLNVGGTVRPAELADALHLVFAAHSLRILTPVSALSLSPQ